jgi:hypothetical protein
VAAFISYDTLTGSSARTPRSWTHLRRTLVTLSAAAKRGRILADTEGVNWTYASAASDRIKAGGLPPCPPLLASSLWTASPACALPGSL